MDKEFWDAMENEKVSYPQAIRFMAENGIVEDDRIDEDSLTNNIRVKLIADLFGFEFKDVMKDVCEYYDEML